MNTLYFGDNLAILRENLHGESVDLIYLDPPFNSKRDYNLIFKCPKGHASDAQITAFEDSWHWNGEAQREFHEVLHQTNTRVAEMLQAFRSFLGENDLMAYLTMMTNRLLALHRALKPTRSLYLHCDPTASHYLKVVLDGVFGGENFKNEISWKRKHGRTGPIKRFGTACDVIFFYTKSDAYTFNTQYRANNPEYIEKMFRYVDENGRRYRIDNLASPNPRPNLMYEYKGYKPPAKGWAISKEKMGLWDRGGKLHFPKSPDGRIQRKRYLDELKGEEIQSLWDDILPIGSQAAERLGYQTQKPLALLERIINASSNEGDLVLDPFCGCGTAVHAAQKLKRRWIGIDLTHLAISLIEKRLRGAFPGLPFEVNGTPKDLDGARSLAERDKYQFQWWACSLVKAQPYQGRKKGPDGGIDGIIYFQDEKSAAKKIIVSVKAGENVGLTMMKDLIATVAGEKAQIGLFITLAVPTKSMIAEAARTGYYSSATGQSFPKIQILTIEGLLDDSQRPRYPDLAHGSLTFNQTKREKRKEEQLELLGL